MNKSREYFYDKLLKLKEFKVDNSTAVDSDGVFDVFDEFYDYMIQRGQKLHGKGADIQKNIGIYLDDDKNYEIVILKK